MDTSGQGLVCAMYQIQKGMTRVIRCGSRTFSGAEQKHYSSKLTFLALKWDFCDHFKENLYYAKSCDLYIDNNLLAHVMSTGKLYAAGQKWANELSDYTFTIYYKPGVENTVADNLPRPSKLHGIRDEGKQVTISLKEVSFVVNR